MRLLDLSVISLAVIGLAPAARAGELDQARLRGSTGYDAAPTYQVITSEPSGVAAPTYAVAYSKAPPPLRAVAPPPAPTPHYFKFEVGSRVWFSTGTLTKNLYDDPRSSTNINSRLTYAGLTSATVEGFGRADMAFGGFFKGNAGFGGLGSGTLNDEDFPPALSPYSNTLSQQQGGKLAYGSIDYGQTVVQNERVRVGVFVGYGYLAETVNANGCTQIAGNPFVCAPAIGSGVLAITEENQWQFARLGVLGEVKIFDSLKLSAEVAWLPYEQLSGHDTHWLRLGTSLFDIAGPIPESGGGTGVQLEAILSYQITNKVSFGVGGRYWYLATHGSADFESVIVGFPSPVAQPTNFTTTRYGGFAQGTYSFGPL
jgi:hypothetical protein